MQFSSRWLRSMVDPKMGTAELNDLLTMSGLEVESCDPVAPPFRGVVVGQVKAVAPHPNADRLRVCQVDTGAGPLLEIVCGAPNVVEGMKAPLATVGAVLPGANPGETLTIRPAKMRGVESHGMLCSARELGLSQDHAGLLALPPDAPVGADVRDVLALDDDIVLIKLTPNRADCLSVLGVAREVSALTGTPLQAPAIPAVPAAIDATFPVKITDAEGCGRFSGRVIRNVDAGAPTPRWMIERLERAGQRSISALVDVTNYVMLELGRPLHVYDLDKLQGGIDVRFSRAGERLKLLNEQTVDLGPDVLAICDASGPIGLAGIMGGDSTKAETNTRNVFLESAFFFPDAIAGRARRFNFASDASHRFERGVDFDNNLAGIERATRLILDICGGEPGPTIDTVAGLPTRTPVRMRMARAQKVIGVPVPAAEMQSIFERLGFVVASEGTGDGQVFVVTPPSHRFDIAIEEDLIEEVARVHGFDNIPARPPLARAAMSHRPEGERSQHDLRECLVAAGYQEVVNFSFVETGWEGDFAGNAQPIRLLNPIAAQYAVMRSTLIGGLVANVRYNLNRQVERVRVFEIGRVFRWSADVAEGPLTVRGIDQPIHVAGIAYGLAVEEQWGTPKRAVDFFDVKNDVLPLLAGRDVVFASAQHPAMHPGRCASVSVGGTVIGWIGELHPALARRHELPRAPVVFEFAAGPLLTAAVPTYEEVSKFPAMVRDLAFLVPDATPAQALIEAVEGAQVAFLKGVRVFDMYRGEGVPKGRKSLALRIVMQDTERTLTDLEVAAALDRIRADLGARFQAELRA